MVAVVSRNFYYNGEYVGTLRYASEEALEADNRADMAKMRMGSIEADLKTERKRLANPKYPQEYKPETAVIIEQLESELVEWRNKYQAAVEDFKKAGGFV